MLKPCVGMMWVMSSSDNFLRTVVLPALSNPSIKIRASFSSFFIFLRSVRRPIALDNGGCDPELPSNQAQEWKQREMYLSCANRTWAKRIGASKKKNTLQGWICYSFCEMTEILKMHEWCPRIILQNMTTQSVLHDQRLCAMTRYQSTLWISHLPCLPINQCDAKPHLLLMQEEFNLTDEFGKDHEDHSRKWYHYSCLWLDPSTIDSPTLVDTRFRVLELNESYEINIKILHCTQSNWRPASRSHSRFKQANYGIIIDEIPAVAASNTYSMGTWPRYAAVVCTLVRTSDRNSPQCNSLYPCLWIGRIHAHQLLVFRDEKSETSIKHFCWHQNKKYVFRHEVEATLLSNARSTCASCDLNSMQNETWPAWDDFTCFRPKGQTGSSFLNIDVFINTFRDSDFVSRSQQISWSYPPISSMLRRIHSIKIRVSHMQTKNREDPIVFLFTVAEVVTCARHFNEASSHHNLMKHNQRAHNHARFRACCRWRIPEWMCQWCLRSGSCWWCWAHNLWEDCSRP